MEKVILAIIICFNFSQVISQTTNSKEIEEQIKQVEDSLGGWVKIEGWKSNILDRMADFKVKGVSIAVIQNYKMIWAKGYGWADEEEKRPVTEKTLFLAGSISKSINGMGILRLAQDKKIDLHADINEYLTSWKFPYDSVSKGKKITLTNLLSHTAGINNNGRPMFYIMDTIPTAVELLNGAPGTKAEPTHSIMAPGLKFEYSNNGIGISQILVSDVTKEPYEKYISETVFKPLKMNNSFYAEKAMGKYKDFMATGYRKGVEIPGKHPILPWVSTGGLWTTPTDLCKFISEIQLSYTGKSQKVLSQEMVKEMLTSHVDNICGLGVFLIQKKNTLYFAHRGGVYGTQNKYFGSIEGGNGVVVMINSEDPFQLIDEIINSVALVYHWKDFYEPVRKKLSTAPDSILQKNIGIYRMPDNKFVYIYKKQDGYYQRSDGIRRKIYFSTETEFFNMDFQTDEQFLKNSKGIIIGYSKTINGVKTSGFKIMSPDTINAPSYFFYNAGASLFEDRNLEEALKYYKRGLQLYPNELEIAGDLANCYLFTDNYEAALKIYKTHVNDSLPDGRKWINMIKQNFIILKRDKFDKSLMDKVFSDLKWEIPEGYKEK